MKGMLHGVQTALGLVLIAGTAIEAPSVGPHNFLVHSACY